MEKTASVIKHRFTVEEYHTMGEAGILHEDDRVELVDGEVVELAVIGWRHAEAVTMLTDIFGALRGTLSAQYSVSVQNPLVLGEYGEHQPDLALLKHDRLRGRLPSARDTLLVVEVADSSLAFDRNVKLPRYAEAGIPEVWILNLTADEIEVHSEPGGSGYGKVARHRRGERIASATMSGIAFDAAEAMPPEMPATEG